MQAYFCSYLDVAIKCGLEESFRDQRESDEILLARELKATCLFNMAYFREAEREAANVLYWTPLNGKALYIYGESLYLQCKVRNQWEKKGCCSCRKLVFLV